MTSEIQRSRAWSEFSKAGTVRHYRKSGMTRRQALCRRSFLYGKKYAWHVRHMVRLDLDVGVQQCAWKH